MPVVDAAIIKGIDIVMYLVKDVERAKTFYRDTLGLAVTSEYGAQGAEFVLRDGSAFGIWKLADDGFRRSGGVTFAVDDIKSAVASLLARGVQFERDGAIEESPVCFMAFGNDTEGNTFLIHQRK